MSTTGRGEQSMAPGIVAWQLQGRCFLREDFLRNLIRRRFPRSALRLCAAMGDCGMLTGQLCQLRRPHARQHLLQGLASWLVTRTRISEYLGILSSLLLITSSKWPSGQSRLPTMSNTSRWRFNVTLWHYFRYAMIGYGVQGLVKRPGRSLKINCEK